VAIGSSRRRLQRAGYFQAKVADTMEHLKADFPQGVDYPDRVRPSAVVRLDQQGHRTTDLMPSEVAWWWSYSCRLGSDSIIPDCWRSGGVVGPLRGYAALGFSIHTLTLFGLVMATRIVVDDAIVVVENPSGAQHRLGLSPHDAHRGTNERR